MKNRILQSFVVVVFLYGVLGFFILPYYIQLNLSKILQKNFAIETYVDSVHMNPFTFEVKISNFILNDQNKKNMLFFETLYLNLQPLSLLQKKIHISDLKIDNLKADIDLDHNKRANFQFLLDTFQSDTKKVEDSSKQNTTLPSIQIDNLVFSYFNFLFTDYSKKEVFKFETNPFDIHVTNFSIDPEHKNNIQFKIATKDSGAIAVDTNLITEPLLLSGYIELENINIDKIFHYLKTDDINFDLHSQPLNLKFGYKLTKQGEDLELVFSKLVLAIPQISLFQDKYGATLTNLQTDIGQIDLKLAKDVFYKLTNINLQIQKTQFEDNNIAHHLDITNLNCEVANFSSKKDELINSKTTLDMPQQGSLQIMANATQEPLEVTADIELKDATLIPYEKYLQQVLNLGINSFNVSTKSKLIFSSKDDRQDIELHSDVILEKISIKNSKQEQKIIDIQKIDLQNIVYKDNSLKINSVTINKPILSFYYNHDTTTNFSNLPVYTDKKPKESETKALEDKPFALDIKKIHLKNGIATLSDSTIEPNFNSKEEKIELIVKNFSLDPNEKTEIIQNSIIDKYAILKAKGVLHIAEPLKDLDVSVLIQNIDLPSLSTYSGKFIGNKITNGKLALSLDHKIKQGQLQSKNNLHIQNIKLGEKVESKDAINAPIGLAIALLEDSKGVIDLDIPMKGDVTSPDFDFSDAITDVIVNTIVGIVKAPFKFLALLTGIGGDKDISNIGFEFGSSVIIPTQEEILDTIAEALQKRPHLKFTVKPSYHLQNDMEALQDMKFQQTYPLIYDRTKKFEEVYPFIKEQFIKLYTNKEYKKLEGDDGQKYPYMVQKLKETIKVEQQEIEKLGRQRAMRVKEFLVAKGIEIERVNIAEEYTTDKIDLKLNQIIVSFVLDVQEKEN